MKDFPLMLAVAGTLIITLSGILGARRKLPVLTCAGYALGFIAAALFAATTIDPVTGSHSNFWLIWLIIAALAVIAGILLEIFIQPKPPRD